MKVSSIFIGAFVIIFLFAILGGFDESGENYSNSKTSAPIMTIEEIKSNASVISYDDLMRHNDVYVGDIIYYRGEILQVSERRTDTYILRVATKQSTYGYHDDIIYVNYKGDRLLEGDLIDIWGKSKGLKTYEAILGNQITIPEIDSLHVTRIT
ncbi:MAG: hypothetical protein U9N46_03080 [Euryarchaeota archaeon]|nr:MAG: hypothetical protein C5S47_06015 [ANME-2 cluster archaeon]MEA1864173.1 hypothetical protein [Euryarchaeota archaeon]